MTSKSKSFTTETKLVQELAIIFDEKDLTELELETDDISIRLARGQKDQKMLCLSRVWCLVSKLQQVQSVVREGQQPVVAL